MKDGQRQTASARGQVSLFARNFIKHPKMLGSAIPSSRFLIEDVLSQVDFPGTRVLVEYGPGVGTFTREILRRMRPDATLLAFETNTDFVRHIDAEIKDPRLHLVHGSAGDVDKTLRELGRAGADNIISGIPFSTMPAGVRDSLLENTREVLRPDGGFLVYQFSRKVLPHLQRVFGQVRQGFEPLNILPAHLFFCSR